MNNGYFATIFAFATPALGCSSGPNDGDAAAEEGSVGIATKSLCSPGGALTYESFGKPFLNRYCTRCHSTAVTGDARQSAPADHNFDTLEDVLAMAEHIDTNAAGGPAALNTTMPPSGPFPTEAERRRLGEWLACEVSGSDADMQSHGASPN